MVTNKRKKEDYCTSLCGKRRGEEREADPGREEEGSSFAISRKGRRKGRLENGGGKGELLSFLKGGGQVIETLSRKGERRITLFR